MKLFQLIIFALALSESLCDRDLILVGKTDREKATNKLLESAVSTLLSCYENKVDTLGVAGVEEPDLQKLLLTKQPLPVKLLSNTYAVKGYYFPHKTHLFVVEAISIKQVYLVVSEVLRSRVSGNLATFLIIDWKSQKSQKGCSNVYLYLHETAWFWGILNVFYVCFDKLEDKVLVYTYNPYTNRAPEPWRLTNDTYTSYLNDHPWSLFVREHQPGNRQICENLNFDKDHDLSRVNVKCAIQVLVPLESAMRNPPQINFDVEYPHASSVLKALNATVDLYLFSSIRRLDNIALMWSPKKNITVPLWTFDMLADYASNLDAVNAPTSSWIMSSGLSVLTQYKGEMSQIDKLLGVLDRSTRYSVCLVVLMTFLFFKYFMRQPLGTATLNVVRIVGNSCLLKEPQKVAPRLYLAGVFILVVTIVGIYQGVLASLLTKPKPLPDVETWEDLLDSPHEIHILGKYAGYFTDPKFNGRIVKHITDECIEYVLRDHLAACVDVREHLTDPALQHNLHLSRDIIVPMYNVYIIRSSWAPRQRFDEIIDLFTTSHVRWYVYQRQQEWKMEAAEYKAELERDRPVVMVLSNLGFAFAFLGIGLSLATVAFIFEVAIKRA